MPKRICENENKETSTKVLKVEVLPKERKELLKIETEEIQENVPSTSRSVIVRTGSVSTFLENDISKKEKVQENNALNSVMETEHVQTNEVSPLNSDDNRYSFNYWGDCVETNEEKEITKIVNLNIEKTENTIRVTFKSEVKDTKFGKVVSCLVADDTGEIAIASFGKSALDIYKNWQPNHVFCIENFKVQKENVNFPSGSNNELQLKINQNFLYKKIEGSDCPPIQFTFKLIHENKSQKQNIRVGLLGILFKDYGLQSNTNNVLMRDLSITDNKKSMIIATLWGAAAEKFKSIENSVIAIRKGVVSEYQEKTKINCTMGTLVLVNPNIPEASPLLKWFNENKRN